MYTNSLVSQLQLTSYVMQKNLAGLSHEETLQSPEGGGNCMNWVVGHIVRGRVMLQTVLGQDPMFDLDELAIYNDKPLANANRAMPIEELLKRFDALQDPLATGLAGVPAEMLSKKAPFSPANNPDETVGSLLAAFLFHEAYHVGQTGIQRRGLGKRGAVEAPAVTQ